MKCFYFIISHSLFNSILTIFFSQPAFGASNTFGATNTFGNTPSNFGSTPNAFGSPTNATGFTGQSNFGNTNASQGFGAANNQSNPFGAKPASSGFGGNFGTPQQTGFGSTATPTANTFGATNPIGIYLYYFSLIYLMLFNFRFHSIWCI